MKYIEAARHVHQRTRAARQARASRHYGDQVLPGIQARASGLKSGQAGLCVKA